MCPLDLERSLCVLGSLPGGLGGVILVFWLLPISRASPERPLRWQPTTVHLTVGSLAGFMIYFGYGIRNSVEGKNAEPHAVAEKPLHHPELDLSPRATAV